MEYCNKKWTQLFLCMFVPGVFAADLPNLDFTGVGAGVVGRNLSSSPTPETQAPKRGYMPPPPAAKNPLPAEMYKITLQLNKIVISGNHALSTEELQAVFKPALHKTITLAKLQELVDVVTQKYQDKGYFLSKAFLPPQQIKNGVVQVTVVEGFISKMDVQGLKSPRLTRFLQKYEKSIVGIKPIKLATLERLLLLLNDIPGFTVKSVLSPDPKTPLGSILTLVTEYKPMQAMLLRDNYQTLYLGPNETSFFGSMNSWAFAGGTLTGRALSADQYKQLNYYELKHDQVLGTNGLVFTLDAYQTKTNPQFILKPLELLSVSSDANVVLSYPLIRSRTRTLYIQGQFDYMSNTSSALSERLYQDEIRDATLGLVYNDSWLKGDNNASLMLDKGFNFWGANNNQFHSRFGAVPDYLKIVGTASRVQYVTSNISLYALVTAQYANRVLYAAETMTFGGPYLGRGYDWSQFTGDQGVAGKAEVRFNTFPNLKYLQQLQLYTFYDAGELYSRIEGVPSFGGASGGFGLRSAVMKHVNAEMFVGKPLTTPNATQVVLGQSGYRFQWYFQITADI